MRLILVLISLALPTPSFAASVIRQPAENCFEEGHGTIPPPPGGGMVLKVRANHRFYLPLGESVSLRLDPRPQDRQNPQASVAMTLDSSALVIDNQTLRRFRPESDLSLGQCYVMQTVNIDAEWQANTPYNSQLICATEPARALDVPVAPTVGVTARRPTYGTSGRRRSEDSELMIARLCGDATNLISSDDNITVKVADLGNDLAIVHLALKSENEVVREKVVVVSQAQVERHGQVAVGFKHPKLDGLSVSAWVENLDGALGPATDVTVEPVGGCTSGSLTPWLMVLLLGLRRRLRC
jgi:hypothetical protein